MSGYFPEQKSVRGRVKCELNFSKSDRNFASLFITRHKF